MTTPNASTDTPTGSPAETTVGDELAALKRIAAQLDSLDPTARQRTMRWLVDRYPVEEATG